jgi:hypothetical protein
MPPRATLRSPALLALLATIAVLLGGSLAVAAPADAAKPCWERALDDWADNGRMDGVYSQACLRKAIDNLPEDLRIYSNAPEIIGGAALKAVRERLPQSAQGPNSRQTQGSRLREIEPDTSPRDEGPISSVLGSGTTDASSIPLPLLVLAGLALLLMAAGAAGFAHRKLQARRVASGDK